MKQRLLFIVGLLAVSGFIFPLHKKRGLYSPLKKEMLGRTVNVFIKSPQQYGKSKLFYSSYSRKPSYVFRKPFGRSGWLSKAWQAFKDRGRQFSTWLIGGTAGGSGVVGGYGLMSLSPVSPQNQSKQQKQALKEHVRDQIESLEALWSKLNSHQTRAIKDVMTFNQGIKDIIQELKKDVQAATPSDMKVYIDALYEMSQKDTNILRDLIALGYAMDEVLYLLFNKKEEFSINQKLFKTVEDIVIKNNIIEGIMKFFQESVRIRQKQSGLETLFESIFLNSRAADIFLVDIPQLREALSKISESPQMAVFLHQIPPDKLTLILTQLLDDSDYTNRHAKLGPEERKDFMQIWGLNQQVDKSIEFIPIQYRDAIKQRIQQARDVIYKRSLTKLRSQFEQKIDE